LGSVPRLWPGQTICCIAAGPSLTRDDCAAVRGQMPVIAVNSVVHDFAPWADVLYACDFQWWNWHDGMPGFTGRKFSLSEKAGEHWPDVTVLADTGVTGLELEPTGLRSGKNSGYQAINLAVHLGASRILLLGYDLQVGPGERRRCHPDHPISEDDPVAALRRFRHRLSRWIEHYATLVGPLDTLGVEVWNCTRSTAMRCFPQMTLEVAHARLSRAA
jgi:hypothetical protein